MALGSDVWDDFFLFVCLVWGKRVYVGGKVGGHADTEFSSSTLGIAPSHNAQDLGLVGIPYNVQNPLETAELDWYPHGVGKWPTNRVGRERKLTPTFPRPPLNLYHHVTPKPQNALLGLRSFSPLPSIRRQRENSTLYNRPGCDFVPEASPPTTEERRWDRDVAELPLQYPIPS